MRAQVTLHTAPPGSRCSPPRPGSREPGTTSPGERTARLRLLQRHAGLCRAGSPRLLRTAPETGASRGCQHGPQRRAGDAKAAAAATRKPVCEHRSLSTPPLLGACAACHCQGPVIQGQLPRENARRASGYCNVTPASATAGSPHIQTPPSPRPE